MTRCTIRADESKHRLVYQVLTHEGREDIQEEDVVRRMLRPCPAPKCPAAPMSAFGLGSGAEGPGTRRWALWVEPPPPVAAPLHQP